MANTGTDQETKHGPDPGTSWRAPVGALVALALAAGCLLLARMLWALAEADAASEPLGAAAVSGTYLAATAAYLVALGLALGGAAALGGQLVRTLRRRSGRP